MKSFKKKLHNTCLMMTIMIMGLIKIINQNNRIFLFLKSFGVRALQKNGVHIHFRYSNCISTLKT